MKIALSLAMGNAADAVEIMCVGFIMTDMGGISTYHKEFLSAAVFIGMLVGGLLVGYASDIVGRKPCLQYSLLLNTVAGLISAAAPNIEILIACRVVGGLGIGGSVPVVFSLGAEIFPSTSRGKYLSLIASFWMVGAIFTAFSAWVMLGGDLQGNKIMPGVHWRPYAVVCALPAIVALLLTHLVVPESPRYLLEKGRLREAAEVLSAVSCVKCEVADLEEREGQGTVAAAGGVAGSAGLWGQVGGAGAGGVEGTKVHSPVSTIGLLFRGPLLPLSLPLLLIWFTLSFGSYGLSTWISVLFTDVGIGNPYAASFIFALANLPGNIISFLFIEVYGRRVLLSAGMCLAAGSALGFAFDTSIPAVVVLCASLFNAFSVVGWNSLDCLSVECFPTHVRTSAMGLLAASGRLGAMSAQFVNGSLEKNVPLLLFVTSACSILGGLAAWLLPYDTTGAMSDVTDVKDEDVDVADVTAEMEGETGWSRDSATYSPIRTSFA
ncbi:major facilitator superfamily domain-containing protein [Ochromonadaceae sp. CCMP2298]|nr:major facilitator superfamily domain-containing protein [Ochromonadaceae sp. CCMP2298]